MRQLGAALDKVRRSEYLRVSGTDRRFIVKNRPDHLA
jgi:hypothetical protein